MKYLFIINDSPYGSQRTYNALRLTRSLTTSNTKVSIFLLGDGVINGLRRQSPADASYNVQEMLKILGASVSWEPAAPVSRRVGSMINRSWRAFNVER